jgi:hypothetical protein
MVTNTKYRIYNQLEQPPQQKTIIVLGLGRSGTSFIASVLDYLGCFMGERVTQRTMEDALLSKTMEAKDDESLRELIADTNDKHDVWGFKRPSSILHINRIEPMFRNPHYIFTHRDFFAIALRNEVSIGRDVIDGLASCMKSGPAMYDLMAKTTKPSLHISFEIALTKPVFAAELIREFVFPEQKGSVIDAVDFHKAMSRRHEIYLGEPEGARS